ncbi:MAG TPA: pectinesterase family protein [Blastocatellia bacterium]|nr:pectinesterase family protein [Blastocatellia bacterium]
MSHQTRVRITLGWLVLLAACAGRALAADATVAPNGDGQFKSIHDAIMAAPQGLPSAEYPWVIHVKPGVYKELIYVQRERRYIRLEGEDAATTIITFNLNATLPGPDGKPIGTFRTPTVQVDGDGFSAENITFENSAGPVGQALALRVDADQVSFNNCRFLGWQDTILLNRGRQYFEDCYITGHVDFIFGGATAFFERCHIHVLRDGYITAASTPENQPYGFVFNNCRITGEPGVRTYLGRPWRGFAHTVFLNTEMSEVVRPEGWHHWTGPEREKTARYAEYHSTGAGSGDAARVRWARRLTADEAQALTREKVLGGWNPKAPIKAEAAPARRNPYDHPLLKGRVKTDIEYAQAGGESLKLDAFVPAGEGPFPGVIFVHGGGWSGGDKRGGNDPLFVPVAERGIAWFTINYRLAPKHHYPAPVEDVHTAIRWVKAHAAEYNVDPNRLALVGESAGGQLVAQAAVLAKEDARVAAVAPFYAPVDFVADMERRGGLSTSMRGLFGRTEAKADEATLQLLREASPINHVRAGLPPFLLVHGTGDMSVLYNWSPQFQSKLRAVGVECDLITIPDGRHGMANWESFAPEYKNQVADWLAEKLGVRKVKGDAGRMQIFLIGDSTMANKPMADNPERGWGQLLPAFFTDGVAISNHAVNGRSTKSFIDEGRWDAVLKEMRAGDWVFIQFGHNDEKAEDPARYAAPHDAYRRNLTRFVNEARGRGAHPVLLTPVVRRRFDKEGKFFDTHGEYPDVVRALSRELAVPLIDLHESTRRLIERRGVEGSKKLFLWVAPGEYKSLPEGRQDDTHFSEYGAREVAALAVKAIRELRLEPARFLKP